MSEDQGVTQQHNDAADNAGAAGNTPEDKGQEGNILFPNDKADGEGKQPENKPDDGKEPDKGKDDAKTGDKVPEDGKYDLKMPEGIPFDEEMAKALAPDFKELGLSNAQAQKLVDKYIEVQSKRMSEQSEKWGETINSWIDEAKTDKEIGGDKWDATVSQGRRAVEQFGTPALREYLNASGGGNHPEMIRFMAKVGALLKEDNPA